MAALVIVAKLQHQNFLGIQTGSMVPAYHRGDLVVVKPVPLSGIHVGDVVTIRNYRNPATTITHRVIAVPAMLGTNKIQTKGDANSSADVPVPAKYIVGRVAGSVPRLGYLATFLHTLPGLVVFVYVPMAAISVSELKRLARYYQSRQRYVVPGRRAALASGTGAAMKVSVVATALIMTAMCGLSRVNAQPSALVTLQHGSATILRAKWHSNVLIQQLALHCSPQNTPSANVVPNITLYNAGVPVNLRQWTLRDSGGTLYTFPSQVIKNGESATVSLDLSLGGLGGLQYNGDHVSLFSRSGQEIDGLSWGSDISEFPVPLPDTAAGVTLSRTLPANDTNSAQDWQITMTSCSGE